MGLLFSTWPSSRIGSVCGACSASTQPYTASQSATGNDTVQFQPAGLSSRKNTKSEAASERLHSNPQDPGARSLILHSWSRLDGVWVNIVNPGDWQEPDTCKAIQNRPGSALAGARVTGGIWKSSWRWLRLSWLRTSCAHVSWFPSISVSDADKIFEGTPWANGSQRRFVTTRDRTGPKKYNENTSNTHKPLVICFLWYSLLTARLLGRTDMPFVPSRSSLCSYEFTASLYSILCFLTRPAVNIIFWTALRTWKTTEISGNLPSSSGIFWKQQNLREFSGNGYGRFKCCFWECYVLFHVLSSVSRQNLWKNKPFTNSPRVDICNIYPPMVNW